MQTAKTKPEPLQPLTTYPAVVGRILVLARQKTGMDQATLSTKVGLAQSTWSRIEHGESAFTIEQLTLAAQALGTTPSRILADADQAAAELRARGVVVEQSRIENAALSGLALIGAVALGILIAKVLTSK